MRTIVELLAASGLVGALHLVLELAEHPHLTKFHRGFKGIWGPESLRLRI